MNNFIVTELSIRPRPGSATFRFWAASEAALMQLYIYKVVFFAYRNLCHRNINMYNAHIAEKCLKCNEYHSVYCPFTLCVTTDLKYQM